MLVAGFTSFVLTSFFKGRIISDREKAIEACLIQQFTDYDDLCKEESSGYESMSPSEAHFRGVLCAVESTQLCVGWKK